MAPFFLIDFVGQKESKKCFLSQSMGKSRKYSKGHSSGFLPDNRHAVATMGEADGIGSSGHIDTEMTVSEDSFASKRKRIGLSVDGYYDDFGVPMQILSLSKMSRFERKDVELKLKKELEQVRFLQRKVGSVGSNVVVLSPSSDIQSCSDDLKRAAVGAFHRASEVSVSQDKKQAPPGRNGIHTNKGRTGTVGAKAATPAAAPAGVSNCMLMKQCEALLNQLMTHQFGWVFNTPVNVVKLNIPDYFTVIKHPMDLGTVKGKIVSGEYSNPLDFAADVRLTFANAMKYNPPGNDVHIMAKALSKIFEGKWKSIEKRLPVALDRKPILSTESAQAGSSITEPPSKKKKIVPADYKIKPEAVKRVMTDTDVEKHKLSTELEASLVDLPETIIDFLKQHSNGGNRTGDDEIEIDIDALSEETLFKLRALLDDYLLEKHAKDRKLESCEKIFDKPGFSNSSLQPRKDSDSDSSSGSDSHAVKASVPVESTEDNKGTGNAVDQMNTSQSNTGDDSGNGLASSEDKSNAPDIACCQDGEFAHPERQVFPDKLYRAAILKKRFADTILKAREKALVKGEKQDPDKLRKEREELERRQKEEKALLEAEAKAAEEARKKAKAEAAAEAKRQREKEREAARRALQQMEKTVDMNETSKFMEDLEMFRARIDDEQEGSIMDMTSPELSQNGFIKLQGSNPLEQLGLFMKDDDEEEDEEVADPPKTTSKPDKDVEEGEID